MPDQTTSHHTANTSSPAMDVAAFLFDLDVGLYEQQIAAALCKVAAAVHDHEKKGSVTLRFDLEHIDGARQVRIHHAIAFASPTKHGKQTEEQTRSTLMHVG